MKCFASFLHSPSEENESAPGTEADINGMNEWRKTMTTKLFAVVLLALALAACDSSSTPESTNANRSASPGTSASPNTGANEQVTPAPAVSTSSAPQFKAGDKVKVKVNGSASDATVVSVDEKLGKVVVKLSGGEEKTVGLSDVTKQ
jgi:ABC-type glycerol-3-phosphate transport system substrate-binding protein